MPVVTVHELKTWPEEFQAVLSGQKRHEVRRNDRNFQPGDEVVLKEWDKSLLRPIAEAVQDNQRTGYTGMQKTFFIGHITAGPSWGLPAGLVVFTLLEATVIMDGWIGAEEVDLP